MSETWYFFALGALVLMGVQRFLYKVSAERNFNTAGTTFAFMGTVAVLSAAIFLFSGGKSRISLFVAGFGRQQPFLLLATVTHIEALKAIPTSIAYPIIRLNVVPVVIFSVAYFKDRLSGFQLTGIALAVAVMLILTREAGGRQKPLWQHPARRFVGFPIPRRRRSGLHFKQVRCRL